MERVNPFQMVQFERMTPSFLAGKIRLPSSLGFGYLENQPHSIARLIFLTSVDEFWEPVLEGLSCLKVRREIPAIAILLSTEDFTEK